MIYGLVTLGGLIVWAVVYVILGREALRGSDSRDRAAILRALLGKRDRRK